jgi:hypothetical protein
MNMIFFSYNDPIWIANFYWQCNTYIKIIVSSLQIRPSNNTHLKLLKTLLNDKSLVTK